MIRFGTDGVEVDAAVLGEGLGIAPGAVHTAIREGRITCLCERGVDADAGFHRLTFFTERRRLRLVVDEAGRIVRRSMIDFGDRSPASVID